MKWSFAAVGLFIIGLVGIVAIIFFTDATVTNEQDYYALKEATEASMIDSIDIAYYRLTGEIKICEEKFVENFTRRFSEISTFGEGNYSIEFYQIIESPAKVSIRIVDNTNKYNILSVNSDSNASGTKAKIVNEISMILDGTKSSCD